MSRRNCIPSNESLASSVIGLVEGGLKLRGEGGDSEDAASGGDDLSVFESSTGVKDYYVFGGLIACGLIVF